MMELIIFFGLLFIGLLIGLAYLFYFIPKKLGYPKIGKILSTLFVLFLVACCLGSIFEDYFFTKNDATELLAEQEIVLMDEFEIEENRSGWSPGDYYHTFTLKISDRDKQKAIGKITTSENFKSLDEPVDNLRELTDRYEGEKLTQNYENKNLYVREYYEPNGKGYAPTYRIIEIEKKGNKLTFEDMD